jgi:hypothetical protein
MRKLIVGLGAAALLALPAAASAGNGYGKSIQDCFGTSYGQAKNAAWESGHASKPALGAKLTAIAHGCAG